MIRPLATARRRALLVASGTAVLLAVGGGATAAVASTTATPSPSATPATCRVHLRAELRGGMPAALKADLKTLRGETTEAAKVAERKVIRQKALTGAYGTRFAKVSHIVAGKAGARTRTELPAALKADLKTLRAMAPKSADRAAERATIERKAVAGDYGTAIQTRAKAVQARFQARCEAKATK